MLLHMRRKIYDASGMSPDRRMYDTDGSTADMSRAKYGSTQKMRVTKKGSSVEPASSHLMSATIHTTADPESLPIVKGAMRSNKTGH